MENQTSFKQRFAGFLGFLTANFLVAGVGGIATASSVQDWYQNLDRPPWRPPDWVFGPVWTALYTLMAIAAWLVWTTPHENRDKALHWYWAQLTMNGLWSWLFFFFRSPWAGFTDIVLLLFAVVRTIREFFTVRFSAALLLLPYLLWISFAAALNLSIALRNR